ncbi:MFS transporter [Actinopolyspora sp. H202]|uniref:MFS transporter n=1 Tax=Actinopolyspora sp. H202 TaxID=1500456 RepID=UPI003EE711BB
MAPVESTKDDEGHPRRWSILVALCAALLVIVMDNTIVNVAIPAIGKTFDASTTGLQAVIDAYVVVFAGLLISAGVASDRYGHRRTVLAGLLTFGAASAAALASWSMWWLIAMRALMGVGAALIMPATLAVLVHAFPTEERPKAFAAWSVVASVAMAVGPIVGGALVTAWSWGGVFLINIPVVLVALIGIARLVPNFGDDNPRRLDIGAAALVTIGMTALVTAIITLGETDASSTLAPVATSIALAALGVFGWRQRRSPAPMVDFTLYRDRAFAGASTAATLLTLGTGSVLFVLLQYLQLVHEHTALQAGLAIVPLALGTVAGSTLGSRAPARSSARSSIMIGFAATATGFVVLATLTPNSSYMTVALGLLLAGGGTGLSSPATYSTVLGAVPQSSAGMGAALNDTHQQLGIALGVAILGSLLGAVYRAKLPASIPENSGRSLATSLAYSSTHADKATLANAARTAFTYAHAVTLLTAAGCALAGATIAAFVLRSNTPRASTSTSAEKEDG